MKTIEHLAGTEGETGALISQSEFEHMVKRIQILESALNGIFAQTEKHSKQWGQAASAMAFARDPATAEAFAAARQSLKG